MFENISDILVERKAETNSPTSPVKVIKGVVDLMKNDPKAVLYNDLSDYPQPRIVYSSEAALKDRVMAIEIEEELEKDVISIELYDATLEPGTPRDRSFCYRVDIKSGKAAESYRKSTGHIF